MTFLSLHIYAFSYAFANFMLLKSEGSTMKCYINKLLDYDFIV